jgi:hypothetical protein
MTQALYAHMNKKNNKKKRTEKSKKKKKKSIHKGRALIQ